MPPILITGEEGSVLLMCVLCNSIMHQQITKHETTWGRGGAGGCLCSPGQRLGPQKCISLIIPEEDFLNIFITFKQY